MRLIADMIAFTVDEVPKWNPINICSYHLQEAGATPVQEIAYSLATAQAVLDGCARGCPRRPSRACSGASRSSSTPASASSRSTRSCARWASCGRRSAASATAWTDESFLRFRYGVQVNSLGLTEAQPENNVIRIVLEALAVTHGPQRSRPRAPAAGLERGARAAAAVGPAVVAADPADPGLRDRPARVPRHLRGLAGDGGPGGASWSRARARRWRSWPSTAARWRPCPT